MCSAIEAHEHSIQLFEVLTKISSPGEGDLRVTQLFSGLACTAYPIRDALYKQLGNLRILRRVSALRGANKTDEPILNILRKALILSSSTDEQYSAATLAKVSSLEQSLTHQNTASALRTLASHRGGRGDSSSPQNRPLDPPGVAPVGVAPEGANPTPGRLSPRRLPLTNLRVFGEEGEGGRSLDR